MLQAGLQLNIAVHLIRVLVCDFVMKVKLLNAVQETGL
jgi:hypothetical protein